PSPLRQRSATASPGASATRASSSAPSRKRWKRHALTMRRNPPKPIASPPRWRGWGERSRARYPGRDGGRPCRRARAATPDGARRYRDGPDQRADYQDAGRLRASDARIEHPPDDVELGELD